jgi:hypothetical protein
MFILKTTQYTCNTPRLSQKYIGHHNLKRGGGMTLPYQNLQANNTLVNVFNKNCGLNYFTLGYQRGIDYGKIYLMNM